jgi:hypothetical protein
MRDEKSFGFVGYNVPKLAWYQVLYRYSIVVVYTLRTCKDFPYLFADSFDF